VSCTERILEVTSVEEEVVQFYARVEVGRVTVIHDRRGIKVATCNN
jgi:hypothetical protein